MDDFDDELIDEDEALDCILFEEMSKKNGKRPNSGDSKPGCLMLFVAAGLEIRCISVKGKKLYFE